MAKLLLLMSCLVFSPLFLFIPVTEPRDFYPFSEQMVSMDTWFYFLFEHLIALILSVVILIESQTYRTAIKVFVFIQVIDTVDYFLCYGEPWFDNVPLSWNIVKVALFGISIIYEKYAR